MSIFQDTRQHGCSFNLWFWTDATERCTLNLVFALIWLNLSVFSHNMMLMISTFRNLFVRIKWDGSLSKCLVHNYYYTTLFCRLCFEMKSAPQWDVTKYSIKKESSQLIGKDLGKSIQYCRDSAASGMNSEGTIKGILDTKVWWKEWCALRNYILLSQPQTLPCPLHCRELLIRKGNKLSSM